MTSPTRRGPGLTGLSASIADPSAHSSEGTTGGSRAGDSFDRREQGAGGLVHRGARVLVRKRGRMRPGMVVKPLRGHLLHQ